MPALADICDIAQRHTRHQPGIQTSALPRVGFYRADQPCRATPAVYEPMLCLVASGKKRVCLQDHVLEYHAGDVFLVALDVPVMGTILEADTAKPYLTVGITLNKTLLSTLQAEGLTPGSFTPAPGTPGRGTRATSTVGNDVLAPNQQTIHTKPQASTGSTLGPFQVALATPDLLDAMLRLLRLLDAPHDAPALAPLYEKEMLYRAAHGPWGRTLMDMAQSDSRTGQIHAAARWLRDHFDKDYSADTLARVANMSVPSLQRHFRALTTMSPLQYQKQLRLQKARRLLLVGEVDVTGAAYAVGYGSASQFNREYRRLFGDSPGRDIEKLKQNGV